MRQGRGGPMHKNSGLGQTPIRADPDHTSRQRARQLLRPLLPLLTLILRNAVYAFKTHVVTILLYSLKSKRRPFGVG